MGCSEMNDSFFLKKKSLFSCIIKKLCFSLHRFYMCVHMYKCAEFLKVKIIVSFKKYYA